MLIIGVDFHPEFQQIAWVDIDTGEFQEKCLAHPEEAKVVIKGAKPQAVGAAASSSAVGAGV